MARRGRRLGVLGLLVTGVLVTGAAAADDPPPKPAVAVVDFVVEGALRRHNPTVGAELADKLRARLRPGSFTILDRAVIGARLKTCHKTQGDLLLEVSEAYDFGRRCAIRYIMLGRVRKRGRHWQVFARLLDCTAERTSDEQRVSLPLGEFPDDVLNALLTKLALESAPTSRPVTGPDPPRRPMPKKPMRVVKTEIVRAAMLYKHIGGWEFTRPRLAIEVTVAIKVAAVPARKMNSMERSLLKDPNVGDSVVPIDHRHFRVMNAAGKERKAPGNWYSGYKGTERVPDEYLKGHIVVGTTPVLAWKCVDLYRRHYYFNAADDEFLVSVVFPGVKPSVAKKIVFQDWTPVPLGKVTVPGWYKHR